MNYTTRSKRRCTEDMPCWDARKMGNRKGWYRGNRPG